MLDRPTRKPEKASYMAREVIKVTQSEPHNTYNLPFKYIAFMVVSILSLILAFCYELSKN
jgi:hypothetical protein